MNTRLIFIGIMVVIIALALVWLFVGSPEQSIDLSNETDTSQTALSDEQEGQAQKTQQPITTMNEEITELEVETTQEGSGAAAEAGDTIRVHYEGRLLNGTVFDSSYKRGEPIEFQVGTGQVIAGWDQGLLGSKVGQKMQLRIPAELAYGSNSVGSIPANSPLIFDVEVVGITK